MTRSQQRVALPGFCSAKNGVPGLTLLEVLVALGILAAVAAVFLLGMSISSKGVMVTHQSVTAESLAKSQLETIKRWPYDDANNPPDYQTAKLTDIPDGYDIDIAAIRLNPKGDDPTNDDGLQQITVTVTHDTETAFIMVGYKAKQ
ncbi:MAG: type II secretion system protein [Chloroflexi bacterium]|nr:type II secretion system protein [Chloroflexota bacterium]